MANYDLVQRVGKTEKKIELNKIPTLNDKNFRNLEVLDSFTRNFNNEEELENYLLKYGLIDYNNIGRKLLIRYNTNGTRKTLVNGITYKDDYKFFDRQYMFSYIMSRSDDIHFLKKLYGNFYSNRNFKTKNYLNGINAYCEFVRRSIEENSAVYDDDIREKNEDLIICVDGFLKRHTTSDTKNGNYKDNYRGLRDLAMFLSNNLKKEKDIEIKEKKEIITQEKEEVEDVKIKKKVKDKNIPGQFTFSDMGWS